MGVNLERTKTICGRTKRNLGVESLQGEENRGTCGLGVGLLEAWAKRGRNFGVTDRKAKYKG